jgi:O-antigen/teichoic acid export membrane protein
MIKAFIKRIPTHLWVAGSAWASRLISAALGLVSIRLLMKSLGTEQYALYAVLGGLQGWFFLTELGIGSSLQNHISERRAGGNQYDDFIVISGAIAIVLLFLSIIVLYFISPILGPAILKGSSPLSADDKGRHIFLMGLISIVASIGAIIYKIWYAEQKGYLANIIPAVASLMSLIAIVVVNDNVKTHKLYFSLIAAFGPAAILPGIVFLRRFMKSLKSNAICSKSILWPLLKRALKFWGFAVLGTGVLQIDYVLMSQLLPAREIVVYNLSTKIFALVFFIYSAVLSALWPVCAEEIARNRWDKVIVYTKKYIFLGTCLIVAVTVMLTWSMPHVINLLSPVNQVVVPIPFILLLGGYQIVRVWTDTFGTVLLSLSYLRPFWILLPFQAFFSGYLQWLLIPRFGIYGVVLGLIGSYLLTNFWGIPLAVYKRSKR